MPLLSLITPPAIEPVTLSEAKLHCRIDLDADNNLVSSLISAARSHCENYCHRALINQTWMISYDAEEFPTDTTIFLPYGKIQSIDSIKTYDLENVATTFDSASYRLTNRGHIALNESYDWPTGDRSIDSVEIRYVVGYGSLAADVPQAIRQAILMTVAHFYENREASGDPVAGDQTGNLLPLGVPALLSPYKIYAI